jgi:tetratricopeptide (TPR) repeat protein
MRGNQLAADRNLADAETLAASLGFRNISLTVLMQRAGRAVTMGDLENGERLHREFLAAADEAGAGQYQIAARRHLGHVLLHRHKPREAADALDRALELSETTGERWNRSEVLGLRAQAALELGDLEAADGFIGRALNSLREEDVTAICEVHYHLGMVRAAQGRMHEAEAALRRSLAAVAHTGYNWNRTEPAVGLARVLAERGRVNEASALIEERERWLREQKITLWDEEIGAVRALIEGRPGVYAP